jgi:hypothetical protein
MQDKKPERNVIGKAGSLPIYDNYGEGVTVRKLREEKLGGGHSVWDYEITIPNRPGIGGSTTKIRGENTVITYAAERARLIRKKKDRGRWK